ncbi:MAG: TetR/AcrR family transcriptional regulator [Actinomycetota bacterium]
MPSTETTGTEQHRTIRTRRAFVDEAERLFARDGIAATSVTDVVEAADRSIGSLYHHFTNKDGLVAAVVDRLLREFEERVTGAIDRDRWHGTSISDILTTFVHMSLQTSVARPGYKRILVEASFMNATVDDRYRRARHRLDEGLVALLIDRQAEIPHPNPEIPARFAIDQLTSMLAARLEASTPTLLDSAPDETFEQEVLKSVTGYLGLPPTSLAQ